MVRWRPASAVFLGGSQEGLALKDRKVRNRVALLSSSLYDPVHRSNEKRDVHANSAGLLANAIGDQLFIAYSKAPGVQPTTLEALTRSNSFFVITVNWPTFRIQFEIEGQGFLDEGTAMVNPLNQAGRTANRTTPPKWC